MPRARSEGRYERPRGDEVHPHAGPDQRRAPQAADRRILAQLHRRRRRGDARLRRGAVLRRGVAHRELPPGPRAEMTIFRSEEHTSELQSRLHIVCRLLLEKKKKEHKSQPAWTRLRFREHAKLIKKV